MGKAKKCNCTDWYLCRHNKTASWNTRRAKPKVVQYRRNSKRLKRGGRTDDAAMWEEKANELDQDDQEEWRIRVASGIVTSPWGANEAKVDKMIEDHKKELETLKKTQDVKRQVMQEKHNRRRYALHNNTQAEMARLRLQVRKLYEKEQREREAEEELLAESKSHGMSNMSANLFEALE